MKQELQDKLYKKYPKIFYEKDLSMQETCMCWGISCGDGWYNILDTLCGLIKSKLDLTSADIERYTNYLQDPNIEEHNRKYFQGYLEQAEKIPKKIHATQVKEKYGTLRFYTDQYCPEIDAYIDFAESMSSVTCEVCGAPGTINSSGWLKVRCEKHKEM